MDDLHYARSANQFGEWETVAHHLCQVAAFSKKFLEPIGYGNWGEVLGIFHDLGKEGELFQQVLHQKQEHVNHAAPGAAAVYQIYGGKTSALLLASVVAAHHSQLNYVDPNTMTRILRGTGSRLDQNGNTFSLFGSDEWNAALKRWKAYGKPPKLSPGKPDFSQQEDRHLAQMLFVRFLYSALVDGDYCSSALHFDPKYLQRSQGPALDAVGAMEKLLQVQREKKERSTAAGALNRLRDQLFENCLAAASQEPGVFSLTAPTGLGKTLSLFAFAVRHSQLHGKRRIILVLPFLSIIEQNASDYRKIVPDILEIHSNTKTDERCHMLSQRWDAPCIITTNVGFLEPLFSARPGACRHLHQLANSVIVLDEAQSLPPHLLDATLRSINLLCSQYGCSVVFSTATQPAFEFRPGLTWKPKEITLNAPALFSATRRVRYFWRIDQPTPLGEIADELAQERQACVIVNLRSHARKLAALLTELLGSESVFYLSTDLCPAHRQETLKKVRMMLTSGQPCHLIATQCIEAGVDLDFPVVYRALAPLDSIIQAAGRCNRNGDSPDGRVTVFVPKEDRLYPPGPFYQWGAACVKNLQSRHEIDCNNLSHIREYYQLLYQNADGDAVKLRQGIDHEDFAQVEQAYRLIENTGVSVIVPYDGRKELYDAVCAQYQQFGLTPGLLRLARPITVNTFEEAKAEQLCQRLCTRERENRSAPIPTSYFLLGVPEFYGEKQGLHWEEESFDWIL